MTPQTSAAATPPRATVIDELIGQVAAVFPAALSGRIVRTLGMTAAVADFPAPVGAAVEIECQNGEPVPAEVIGFRDDLTQLYLLGDVTGVRRGNRVHLVRTARWLRVGPELLGRVIDANGRAIDGRPQPWARHRVPLAVRLVRLPAPVPAARTALARCQDGGPPPAPVLFLS